MKEIDIFFKRAIEDRVFPSASLLIFLNEKVLYKKSYGNLTYGSRHTITDDHLYDVASLTKPLVTSLAIASLVQEGEIRLDMEMNRFFSQFKSPEKLNITIRDMLNHRSGLPSHRKYFKEVEEELWGTLSARNHIINAALNEEIIEYSRTEYSDIDYIILGHLIETVTAMSLRDYVTEYIFKVLRVEYSDFCGDRRFAKEGLMVPVSHEYIGVDDENCRAMGGVAGHAGLFSKTGEIYLLLKEVYNSYKDSNWRLFRPDLTREHLMRSNDFIRSMFRGGFDTPLKDGSQYGDHCSDEAIGHLGFTGTSFLIDLKDGFGVILLTNRVCPDRDNHKIREFRYTIHNVIFKAFEREIN